MLIVAYEKRSAVDSLRAFEKFSVHALKKHFGGAQIFSFERHNSPLMTALDFAGIDGAILTADRWAYFFSSRVQFGKCFETFTIRKERPNGATTEFEKLQRATKTYSPMPTFATQTFVDSDEQSATFAIAPMIDLLQYCKRHNPEIRTTATGEKFFVIPWRELENVKIYRVGASGLVKELTAEFQGGLKRKGDV